MRNIHLSARFDDLIASRIASGQFSDANEVVSEGLRLLEERDAGDKAEIDRLRSSAQEGIDAVERGKYTLLQSPSEILQHLRELRTVR